MKDSKVGIFYTPMTWIACQMSSEVRWKGFQYLESRQRGPESCAHQILYQDLITSLHVPTGTWNRIAESSQLLRKWAYVSTRLSVMISWGIGSMDDSMSCQLCDLVVNTGFVTNNCSLPRNISWKFIFSEAHWHSKPQNFLTAYRRSDKNLT